MTIKLTAAAETDLVIKIAEGLDSTPLKNSFFGSGDLEWADRLMVDLPEDARTKIERFVGERGLSKFIQGEIQNDRSRQDRHQDLIQGRPITQLKFISNSLPYARKLVATLKSIPIRYRLTVALPSIFSVPLIEEVQESILLPSGINIAKGNALPQPLPVRSDVERVDRGLFHDWITGDATPRALDPNRLYFSMPVSGYSSAGQSSSISRMLEDNLRAFYGAATAVSFMGHGWDEEKDKLPYIMIHDETTREILSTESLEDELLERSHFCSTADFADKRKDDIWSAYQTTLKKIGTVFNDDVDCRRLYAACIWFYRAKLNRRPLDALLQATIAIEVMLGDRKAAEGIGLTNLLGSRCAYLLGRSSKHRNEIMIAFRKVYDLRSNVVHEGRHILQSGDQGTVNRAMSLCAAIISRELTIRALPDSDG